MNRILSVDQVAEKLHVRPNTVRDWLKAGLLPGRKIGRIYRIIESDLEEFVRHGSSPSIKEQPARRISAKGAFAHIPGTVDDFLRRKHEENEREERERQGLSKA